MTPLHERTALSFVLVALGVVLGLAAAYALEHAGLLTPVRTEDGQEASARDFDAMTRWFEGYKRDHPDATDEDAKKAFEALWME